MGIMDFIKGELLEVIEWTDDSRDTLSWRFPDDDKAIKNGAQLIVRESQVAQFVYLGQFGDTFGPGQHTLSTDNIPILSTLKGWKYGFESPFKADVYFVTTRLFTGNKWGTSNPIMMRDADFGMLRIRAFGIYSIKVVDSATFLRQVVGTNGVFTVPDISEQLRKTIMSRFTDALGEAKIPALDLAAKYDELSDLVRQKLQEEFKTMGLELSKFFVESISLPEEVEAMMDKRTGVGMMAPVMGAYTQMQVADNLMMASVGLRILGSSTCSQTATLKPWRIKRDRYASWLCTGTPHILMSSPRCWPRLVSAISSAAEAFTASSKNSS